MSGGQLVNAVSVRVWGEFACFTRPEFGAEKVSYPVMTPPAAVGVLEAIHWKPEFEWTITAIDVHQPITWSNVFRNGIGSRQTMEKAREYLAEQDLVAEGAGSGKPTRYDAAGDRVQFNTLLLTNVAYTIHAKATPRSPGQPWQKHVAQLERRVRRGQFFHGPYLGCREFLAHIAPADPDEARIGLTQDLGPMPLRYKRSRNGAVTEIEWFDAHLTDGRLIVPSGGAR